MADNTQKLVEQVSPYAGDELYYCRFGAGNAVVEAVHEAERYLMDTKPIDALCEVINLSAVTVDEAAAALVAAFGDGGK